MNSTKLALLNYSRRQLPKEKRKKKNNDPERQVESEMIKTLNKLGFCLQKIESKATYSIKAGSYKSQSAKQGTSDIVGCAPSGLGVFIEVKAPGKLSTLKQHQAEYLIERAERGAFAGCFDSLEGVLSSYEVWLEKRKASKAEAFKYLMGILPKFKPSL
jgi:hypothetical protein